MEPDPHLQEMLAAIAEEALKRGEKELSLLTAIILGSYRFGTLSQYVAATEAYMAEQSKKAVLHAVAQSVAGVEPLLFSKN